MPDRIDGDTLAPSHPDSGMAERQANALRIAEAIRSLVETPTPEVNSAPPPALPNSAPPENAFPPYYPGYAPPPPSRARGRF